MRLSANGIPCAAVGRRALYYYIFKSSQPATIFHAAARFSRDMLVSCMVRIALMARRPFSVS